VGGRAVRPFCFWRGDPVDRGRFLPWGFPYRVMAFLAGVACDGPTMFMLTNWRYGGRVCHLPKPFAAVGAGIFEGPSLHAFVARWPPWQDRYATVSGNAAAVASKVARAPAGRLGLLARRTPRGQKFLREPLRHGCSWTQMAVAAFFARGSLMLAWDPAEW